MISLSRVQSSITLKLLMTFLVVILLSLAVLVFTLATLTNTQTVQERLTKQALPLLSASQELSKSINDYTILVERVSIANVSNTDLINAIEQQEKLIYESLSKLKKFVKDEVNSDTIEAQLTKILAGSNELQTLIFSKYPEQTKFVKNASNAILQSVRNIRRELQRFRIISKTTDVNTQRVMVSIEDQLTNINEAKGQYNQNMNKAELERLKTSYILAIKKITQQLLLLKNSNLRKSLANETNLLFEQSTQKNGFFSHAFSLIESHGFVETIIQQNSDREKEINSHLVQLLDKSSRNADIELKKFHTIIDHSIILVVAAMVAMVLLSGAALYFYIIPKITRRLNLLANSTRLVSSGHYDIEINTSGTDEISEMAQALDGFKHSLVAKRKADKNLKDREIRLQNIIDNAVDGLITINNKGLIESFNAACEDIFGYSAKEVVGKNVSMLMPLPHQEKHDEYINNYKVTGQKKILGIGREVVGRRKNGSTFPLDISVSKVSLVDGIIYSGIVRDITEQKKRSEELNLSVEELTRSNKDLERFAHAASHDLQEPLRMVASSCDLLERRYSDKLDDLGREFLGYAKDGAKRMQHLIGDILQFSRLETNRLEFEMIDLNETLKHIHVDLKQIIEERNVKIISDELPQLRTQSTYIKMVMQNLIHNAIKFNKSERPTITITHKQGNGFHKLSFSDNGIGIHPQHKNKIFDMFTQLNRKDEFPGSGIGLSVVRKIIEMHKGKIWVEDNHDGTSGTTISFQIPFVSALQDGIVTNKINHEDDVIWN